MNTLKERLVLAHNERAAKRRVSDELLTYGFTRDHYVGLLQPVWALPIPGIEERRPPPVPQLLARPAGRRFR